MSRATIGRLETEVGELLEKHSRARDLGEFERYRDDPTGFIVDILHGSPFEAQRAIAEDVLGHPLVAVRSGVGCGKDWLAARLALWWVYARRGFVLCTGPTSRQVTGIIFGEVRRAWTAAGDLPGELFQSALRLGDGETGILGFVSSDVSRTTGWHAPRVLVLVTEAQGVDGYAFEAALSCAVGEEDRILLLGNPLFASGRFFEACRSPAWKSHALSALDTPNLVSGTEKIPGLITAAGVERIRQEFGVGSGIYRSRVLGQFPTSGESSLLPRDWIDRAVQRWKSNAFSEEVSSAKPVLGVDVARYGQDLTCVAVRRGPRIERLVHWQGLDTMGSVEKVVEVATSCGIWPAGWRGGPRGEIHADEVGVGGGLLDRLQELGYRAFPYNASRAATDPRKHSNVRAESYWSLRKRLEAGLVALPDEAKLLDELAETRWAPDNSGRIAIEGKDQLRSRLGRSPDFADAVVIAMFAGSQPVWSSFRTRDTLNFRSLV